MANDEAVNERGGCLCGNIRYETRNEPYGVVVCLCHFCQKSTGSDYKILSLFRKKEFDHSSGEPGVYEYISEGSGHTVYLHFCRDCGSHVFHKFERFPDCIGVLSGSFDNPNWYERNQETVDYFFLESASQGAIIPPGYRTYSGHGLSQDGDPLEPKYLDKYYVFGANDENE